MDRHNIKKIAKTVTATMLAFSMIAASSTYITARADTLSDLKSKYNQLQKQQQDLQTKLNGLSGQVSDANTKKEAINKNVETLNGQVKNLNDQITALNAQIDQNNKDIENTETDIKNNQKTYEERVCALYEAGNSSKLQLILSSKNVTEFFTRVETLKVISDHDTKLINDLKAESKKLDDQKKSLSAKKTSLDQSKGTLVAKQEDVKAQLAEQKKIVDGLKDSEDQVASEKTEVKQEAAKTDKQINAEIARIAEERRQELIRSGAYKVGAAVNGNKVVGIALAQIGKPYVWAAAGPNSFDCSGLVQYCFAMAGRPIGASTVGDHTYRAINLSGMGTSVPKSALQPGDVVFFATGGGAVNHCGIYEGGGKFIAANTGTKVRVMRVQECSLNDAYWSRCYTGAQRINY